MNIAGVINLARLEGERSAMSHPASDFRLELVAQFRSNVEVTSPWPATQPFHRSACGEINIKLFDAERNRSGRLIGVEHYQRADAMGLLDDGFDILNVGALEEDVRDRREQRLIVNRIHHPLGVNRDPVIARNFDDAGAA